MKAIFAFAGTQGNSS